MNIAIVSIGNEILNGSILDTNSHYLAQTLLNNGYSVSSIVAVGDDIEQMVHTFEALSKNYDLVITTGGLGPTFDDKTTEALAKAAKEELKLKKELYFGMINKIKSKGVALKLSHLRQVYLPENSKSIPNDFGTASGILLKINRAYFISMPGVPKEMKPMFENYVLNEIKALFPYANRFRYDLKFVGVAESDADDFLNDLDTKGVEIILNAMEGELAVRLFSKDKEKLDKIKDAYDKRFKNKMFSIKNETIEVVVDKLLIDRGLKLAIAEDFTGGYLTLLMSDKKSFLHSYVGSHSFLDIKNKVGDNDVLIFPSDLQGNKFNVSILYKNSLKKIDVKYFGNSNFLQKSASKRALGALYEILKLDFKK